MNIVSDFGDNNIFHILRREILPLSRMPIGELQASSFFIVANKIDKKPNQKNWRKFAKIDKDLNQQKWRKFIFDNIFKEAEYVSRRAARKIDNPVLLESGGAFDPHEFIDYPPRPEFIALMNHIKCQAGIGDVRDRYVLLCQRELDNRYLYDDKSNLPLQDFLLGALDQAGIPFRVCDFAKLTPADQAAICGGASIFVSAHGAGLCNMIFMPDDCSVMEFNFRKHWYCDPVCEAHYSGRLAYDEKCGGALTFRPYFHKADYSNLSKLLGKKYFELEVEHYEGHRAKNPVSRRRLFVDGDGLVARIEQNFTG